ncbi:MAG: alpha/beta fold hydrolase [Phycisphaerales bacterium JB038]
MRIIVTVIALLITSACLVAEEPAAPEREEVPVTLGEVKTKDGVKVAFDVRGEGETTLVFIHGWACNRSFWKHQLDVFADDYQVVSLDLPGHGESGTSRETWSILPLADGVQAVVEKLDLEHVILVGHSMGGSVSLEAAARLPERVLGVVGVDTLHDAEFEFPKELMAQFIAAFEADYEGTLRGMMVGMAGSQPELAKWITAQALDTEETAAVGLMKDFQNLEMPKLFEAAGVPIRCVNAAPQDGRGMPTNIEGNRKYADFDAVLMENVGHFLMMEEPAMFNEHLRETLKRLTVDSNARNDSSSTD